MARKDFFKYVGRRLKLLERRIEADVSKYLKLSFIDSNTDFLLVRFKLIVLKSLVIATFYYVS